MERKLLIAFAGLSLVLAVALAGTLTLVTGLAPVSTAFAQGLGNTFRGGCARSGLNLSSMPCLTGNAGATSSAFTPTGIQVTGDVVKDAETAAGPTTGRSTARRGHRQGHRLWLPRAGRCLQGQRSVKSLAYDRAGGIFELN